MRALWPLLLLVGCGQDSEPQAPDTLPQPSGPPIAQQEAPAPTKAAPDPGPRWEQAVSGQGNMLRLVDAAGSEILSLSCAGQPPQLIARVRGFTRIGSEDRFSLALGEEPVTLVADMGRTGPGVEAAAPLPSNFAELLGGAHNLTALYGTQRSGPHAAPKPDVVRAFADNCAKLQS